MNKTDFFTIFIKCIGLFSVIKSVFMMFSNISYSQGNFGIHLTFNGLILLFTFVIAFILIFKTNWVINLFRLDKGFESDEINFAGLKEHSLLRGGIILLGLYFMFDSLPSFLNYTYLWFRKQVSVSDINNNIGFALDYNWWSVSGISIIVGLIMVTNNQRLSKWLSSK